MLLEIEHHLSLDYDEFIRESILEVRMQPKTTRDQTLRSFVLAVGPPTKISRYRDWLGNLVHHFTVTNYHDRIAVAARALVETHPAGPPLAAAADALPLVGLPYDSGEYLQFGGPVRLSPALRKFHQGLAIPAGAGLAETVAALCEEVSRHFVYRKHVTQYDSTTDDFLAAGAGVCQDFTHLALGLLRLRQIPCRYVSGYVHLSPAGPETAQSHAWVEIQSPTRGWIPFDPTHGREIDERYVVVGYGRHYEDVPPNKGIFRGNARESLTAEVYTRASAGKAVSELQEEVESIDLPVFQEIPERRRRDWAAATAEAAAQQQQQ
ncbi:MAG: transglutaminase family protein [Candidatus Rokubacteria bacterium]|nr:transglutaminase family protein [Candidatus Rokubacteria bacterium]